MGGDDLLAFGYYGWAKGKRSVRSSNSFGYCKKDLVLCISNGNQMEAMSLADFLESLYITFEL
jgi:hypothetical protein